MALAFADTSLAATYTLTTFTDPAYTTVNNANGVITGGAGVGLVSLRSAIQAAENNGVGPHAITLQAGTYSVSNGVVTLGDAVNENITFNGPVATPPTAVINMAGVTPASLGGTRDRIFFINGTATTAGVQTTFNNVKFTNGNLSSDAYGGGAIRAGGPTNVLILNNCVFDSNTLDVANGGGTTGGAINISGGGAVSIDSCTFSNNTNPDSDGGAVYYFFQNFAGLTGSLSITNSTFTNNRATAATGSGGAIGIATQGRIAPFNQTFSATIQKNTFLNDTASVGEGGAIIVNNGDAAYPININFNRFIGNSSSNAATSALGKNASSGNVSAINNWWAGNNGPGATGVQRASTVGGAGAGVLTIDRWLQLKTTPGSNPIVTNQSTSLTAGFLSNSANDVIAAGNLTALVGLPVTWSGAGGTVTGQQTTIQAAGTATATYNETTGVAAVHSATAVVDSGPASGSVNTAAITVNKASVTASITSDTPDPTVTGQAVTVNYTLAGASGNSPTVPTGNVSVSDGVNSVTGTVAAGSAAVTLLTAGARTLTATYQGDANFLASPASAGASHQVNKADTTTTISSDTPDPSAAGQAVTVTFTITINAPGSGTPTGNVTISDGVDSVIAAVGSGTGNITLNNAGNRTLTATYTGDANYNASPASAGAPHVVKPVVTASSTNIPATATTVTINGAGFSTTPGNNSVAFSGGATGTVTSATATQLTVTGVTGLTGGNLTAVVTTNGVNSGAAVQVATVRPVVTLSTGNLPNTATTLTINGFGFSTTPGNNTVAFTPSGGGTVTGSTATSLTVTGLAGLSAGPLNVVVTTNGVPSAAPVQVATVLFAPVLAAIEGVALSYTENAPATPITGTLTVSDVDSPNLAGATVQITGNYANGQDLLVFTNQLGITGVFTPASGLMTLSGSTSVANYQTALRAVTYRNTSDNPSTLTRTVTFQANDGGALNNLSNTVTRNINVTAVNDPPVITGQAAVSTAYNTARAIAFADLLVTDVDNAYPTGFTLSVQNGVNYTHVGNTITPALNFYGTLSVPAKVNDGAADSNTFNLAVTVNPDPAFVKVATRIAPEPGGGNRMSFIGNPGQTYTIQFTPAMIPLNWQFLGTRTTDLNGNYSIVDIPPANTPMRFYRSVFP